MNDYKRINRTLVKKGSIIDYYRDTIQVSNGHTVEWDFIDHKGAAAVLAVLDDGRILMVRQFRNAIDRVTLEIPAGGLEPNESTKEAAARECKEETGYTAGSIKPLLSVNTTVAFCNEKIDIYLATQLHKGEQHLDEDEFLGVEAYSLEDLLQKIDSGEIKDSKTVSAILRYALMEK